MGEGAEEVVDDDEWERARHMGENVLRGEQDATVHVQAGAVRVEVRLE